MDLSKHFVGRSIGMTEKIGNAIWDFLVKLRRLGVAQPYGNMDNVSDLSIRKPNNEAVRLLRIPTGSMGTGRRPGGYISPDKMSLI